MINAAAISLFLLVGCADATWTDTPANLLRKYGGVDLNTLSYKPMDDLNWEVTWGIDKTAAKIYVAIEAGTTGWVGLGFSEAAAMRGADIMMAYVDGEGAHVGDYHAVGNWAPIQDGCQDWSIHHGEEQDGSTLIVVSRLLLTQDSNDRPILLTGLKRNGLLAAFGDTDDLNQYHSQNKVKFAINLETGAGASQAPWSAAKAADAELTFIELKANEGDTPPSWTTDQYYRGPKTGGQLLPTDRTAYWEYCFMTSTHDWDHNTWMTAFEAIADGSPANVHHLVLYGFDRDGCHEDALETIVWVGGIGFYEDLPTGVGMSFSRIKSFRLQIHYDNPNGASGLRDNSGVRVWLTSQRPSHEAGSLQLGDGNVRTWGDIPRGRSHYTYTCPGSQTENWPSDITVFGSILHMHEKGDQMYTEVRRQDGTIVIRPNAVEYFDFAHQDPTLVQPYNITRGDTLTTRCYFYNDRRESDTPLRFGLGSDEEMCIDFLYYYPFDERMHEHCTFSDGRSGGTYEGKVSLEESDAGMRVFGVDAGTPSDPDCTGGATTMVKAVAPTSAPTLVPEVAPSSDPSPLPTGNDTASPAPSPDLQTKPSASYGFLLRPITFTVGSLAACLVAHACVV